MEQSETVEDVLANEQPPLPDRPVVACVLARSGSKGIPGKNLKLVGGKTLVRRVVEQSVAAGLETFCFTDGMEIAAEARAAGAGVVDRPASVSGDAVTSEETIREFIRLQGYSRKMSIMLVQPTTPFLKARHIREGVDLLNNERSLTSVISCFPVHRYLGYRMAKKPIFGWVPCSPYRWLRQEQGPVYFAENGGFYLASYDLWMKDRRIGMRCGMVEMGFWESLEIDDPEDLEVAQRLAPVFDVEE